MNSNEKPSPVTGIPLTRREWLLRLGESVALAGFSGVIVEPSLSLADPQEPQAGTAKLPPGLYDPSNEHMSHALVSDQRFLPIPPGSETEYAQPHSGPYAARFFSEDEFKVMHRLVELILNGRLTGTPEGTVDPATPETIAEIAEWIDLEVSEASAVRSAARNLAARHWELNVLYHGEAAMRELRDAQPDRTWREGVEWINQKATHRNANDFVSLPEPEQIAMLNSLDERKTPADPGHELFRLLKSQVIRGFYTSQAGLKELDYKGNSFYAQSPGCEEQAATSGRH